MPYLQTLAAVKAEVTGKAELAGSGRSEHFPKSGLTGTKVRYHTRPRQASPKDDWRDAKRRAQKI